MGGSMRNDKTEDKISSGYVTETPKEQNVMSETNTVSTKASSTLSGKKSASHTSATGCTDKSTLDPTETMIKRWINQI